MDTGHQQHSHTASRVVAVMPVHNRRDTTLQCVESLERSRVAGIDLRIVVVDDGSTDGTGEALRRLHPTVEIIKGDGSLWYTAGTNRGLSAALRHDPDFVLAMNDDAVVPPSCLPRIIACARKHPRSVVTPLLVRWDDYRTVFQIAPIWSTWYGGWRHWLQQTVDTVPEEPFEAQMIVGNAMLIPADAIRQQGLMLEKWLPQYFGDAEYTVRLRRAGWRLIVEPRAQLWCMPNSPPRRLSGSSPAELWRMLWVDRRSPYNLRARFLLAWRTAPSKMQAIIACIVFLVRVALKKAGRAGARPNGWPEQPVAAWARRIESRDQPFESHLADKGDHLEH